MRIPLTRPIASAALGAVLIACSSATARPDGDTGARPAGALPAAVASDDSVARRVAEYLERAEAHGLAGAVLLERRGRVLVRRGFGMADREHGERITPETPFFIASLGKQFTAAAILVLEEEGKLRTTDSVAKFLPRARGPIAGVTVHQLLNHTSGLPYLPPQGLFGAVSRDSAVAELLATPLEFAPGTRYSYSSPGYALLAVIAETAAREPFEQVLRTRLFEPAGMRATGFVGEPRWRDVRVRSYSDDAPEPPLGQLPASTRMLGAGAVITTLDDLHRWARALEGERPLTRAAKAKLFAPSVAVRDGVASGYGWNVVTLPTGTLITHAGDMGGYNADFRRYVDEGFTLLFLSNTRVRGRGHRELVVNNLARLVRGENVPMPPRVAADVPASAFGDLAGFYSLVETTGSLRITVRGDSVTIGALGAEGIAALSPMDSSGRAIAAVLSARAELVLREVAAGRPVPDSLVHPSLGADVRAVLAQRLAREGDTLATGPHRVLGTTVLSATEAETYLAAPSRTRPPFASIQWASGRIIGVRGGLAGARLLTLRPESRTSLVSWDLSTGMLVRVRLLDGGIAVEAGGRMTGAVHSMR